MAKKAEKTDKIREKLPFLIDFGVKMVIFCFLYFLIPYATVCLQLILIAEV